MLLIILHIGHHDLGEGDHENEHFKAIFKAIYRDENVCILLGISIGYTRSL